VRTREFKTLGSSPVLEEEEIRKYDVVIELLASTGLIGKIIIMQLDQNEAYQQ
jgi:hypothetical protein